MKNQKGFTLIEILIALSILAALSVLSVNTITSALRSKDKLQGQIDDVSRIRDALRLMERDLNLAYHHYDFEKDIADQVRKLNTASATGNPAAGNPSGIPGAGNFPVAPVAPTPTPEAPRLDPATHFVGTEDSMNFVTLNNGRITKNIRQADFIEVGYALKDCKSIDGSKTSKCLWRRTSLIVDSDVTKGGDELVLLQDVSEFSLKYIGPGKTDWVKDWRSDKAGDGATKDNFPLAVEISLTVTKGEKDKKKKYPMQITATIHNPNNPEKKADGSANTTQIPQ